MDDTPLNPRRPHHEPPASRRDFLLRAGGGLGSLALFALLQREVRADVGQDSNPVNPRQDWNPVPLKTSA